MHPASPPHIHHLIADVDADALFCFMYRFRAQGVARRASIEMPEDVIRQEPAAWCKDMTVAAAGLVVRIETLWVHEVKLVPGPRHGDVEQAALLLDLLRAATGHV